MWMAPLNPEILTDEEIAKNPPLAFNCPYATSADIIETVSLTPLKYKYAAHGPQIIVRQQKYGPGFWDGVNYEKCSEKEMIDLVTKEVNSVLDKILDRSIPELVEFYRREGWRLGLIFREFFVTSEVHICKIETAEYKEYTVTKVGDKFYDVDGVFDKSRIVTGILEYGGTSIAVMVESPEKFRSIRKE